MTNLFGLQASPDRLPRPKTPECGHPQALSTFTRAFIHRSKDISNLTRLRQLRAEFCVEQDPVKRQQILDHLLTLIEEKWKHLLGLIADEHDPAELRAMIMELNTILEARKREPLPKPPEISATQAKDAKQGHKQA